MGGVVVMTSTSRSSLSTPGSFAASLSAKLIPGGGVVSVSPSATGLTRVTRSEVIGGRRTTVVGSTLAAARAVLSTEAATGAAEAVSA